MADVFSKRKRSEVMSRIRSRGNRDTELAMVRLLRAHKISGWRRHVRVAVESSWLSVEGRKRNGVETLNHQPSTLNLPCAQTSFSENSARQSSWTAAFGMAVPSTRPSRQTIRSFGGGNFLRTRNVIVL
jgi:hypothetical protein